MASCLSGCLRSPHHRSLSYTEQGGDVLGATRCFPGKASKKRGRRVFSQECVCMGPHNPTATRTERLFWKQEENESCAPGLKDLQDTVLPSRMFTVGVTKDLVMDDQGFSKCHTHRRTYIRRQTCTVPNRQAIRTTEKGTGPHLKMTTLLLTLLLGLAYAQLNTVDVSTVGEEDGV